MISKAREEQAICYKRITNGYCDKGIKYCKFAKEIEKSMLWKKIIRKDNIATTTKTTATTATTDIEHKDKILKLVF